MIKRRVKILLLLLCAFLMLSCDKQKNVNIIENRIYCQDDFRFIVGDSANIVSNQIKHYVTVNQRHFFDLYEWTKEGLWNDLLHNTAPERRIDIDILGIDTDGESLYFYAYNYNENNGAPCSGLYRINIDKDEVFALKEWEAPRVRHSNYSMVFHENYIYYFEENTSGGNDICRIRVDGTEFQKLTDNRDGVFTGLFFVEDTILVQMDRKLYVTRIPNIIENMELFLKDIYSVEVYDNMLYCTSNSNNQFLCVDVLKKQIKVLANNVYNDCYLIKGNAVYYSPQKNVRIGKFRNEKKGMEIINNTNGEIWKIDLRTLEQELVYKNSNIDFRKILNIDEKHENILAQGYTNEQQLFDRVLGDGLITVNTMNGIVYFICGEKSNTH